MCISIIVPGILNSLSWITLQKFLYEVVKYILTLTYTYILHIFIQLLREG